jgi:tetratricopeptide (TPR) repeat protein
MRWATCFALAIVGLAPVHAQQSDAEKLIDAGHWKKARTIVEARIRQAPNDAPANFLLSQIRNAFGDYATPPSLAEKAVALDGRVAKYHRQLAEVLGVEAQHAGPIRIVFLAHQFRGEIDTAISLDPSDIQAQRDLLEYYLVAPGIAGGDVRKAVGVARHIGGLNATEGYLAQARLAAYRKQVSETEAMLRCAVEAQRPDVSPASYRARVELAKFYLGGEHRNLNGAEATAKELLNMDRDRVDAYLFLAQIYAERGDWVSLDTILTEGAQENPDDLAPYFQAAETLSRTRRDPARAQQYLAVYLEHEPEGNEPSLKS